MGLAGGLATNGFLSGGGGGGGGKGLPSTFVAKTGPYTAATNDFVTADASGGTFAITTPPSPSVGDLFAVIKVDSSANAVTIAGTVDGGNGASITQQWYGSLLEYSGATYGWIIVSSFLAGGGSTVLLAQREQAKLAALGLSGQTFDLWNAPSLAANPLVSQQVTGQLIGAVAGDVMTNLLVFLNTVGVGTVPTGIFLGVYSTAGTLLASTANVASDAKWTTSQGFISFALSSPLTIASTAGYYLAILENGAFATTPMKVETAGSNALTNEHSPSAIFPAVIQNTQATLPASASFAAVNPAPVWMGWN